MTSWGTVSFSGSPLLRGVISPTFCITYSAVESRRTDTARKSIPNAKRNSDPINANGYVVKSRNTGCFFYDFPEHSTFIAQTACIRRHNAWQVLCICNRQASSANWCFFIYFFQIVRSLMSKCYSFQNSAMWNFMSQEASLKDGKCRSVCVCGGGFGVVNVVTLLGHALILDEVSTVPAQY